MLLKEQRIRYLLIGGCLLAGLLLSILVLTERSGATSEASTLAQPAKSSAANQFSVLDSSAIGWIPAENETALTLLTESALPGNDAPVDVSEFGTVTAAGGKNVTVALLGESLCVVQAMNSACGLVDDVADGRLVGARPHSCGYYWVFGLAPDGVNEIQVDQGKAGKVDNAIQVVGNVFEGVLEAASTSLTGINGSGKTVFETSLPLDYFADTNEACS